MPHETGTQSPAAAPGDFSTSRTRIEGGANDSFFLGPAFLRRPAAKSQKPKARFSPAELAAEKARRELLRLFAAQGRGATAFASDRRALAAAQAESGSLIFNNSAT